MMVLILGVLVVCGLFDELAEDTQHADAKNGIGDDPEAVAKWGDVHEG
jgi:hypothetical protein